MLKVINKIAEPVINLLPENNRFERIWILAKFEFKKRYYDSALGMVWALLNPLFRLAVYTFAFKYIRDSNKENFSLYLFSGLLIWMFFTELTNKGMNALKQKKYLVENIQFNWIDIFYALTASTLIGTAFNFMAYFVMSLFFQIYPSIYTLWFPLLILNMSIITLGFSIILASLNIFIKDINHVWSIVILAGFWTAPIFFYLEDFPEKYNFLLYIHPASSVLINIRNSIFYNQQIDWMFFAWGWFYALITMVIALLLFNYSKIYAVEKF